jgi:hypothetical protein
MGPKARRWMSRRGFRGISGRGLFGSPTGGSRARGVFATLRPALPSSHRQHKHSMTAAISPRGSIAALRSVRNAGAGAFRSSIGGRVHAVGVGAHVSGLSADAIERCELAVERGADALEARARELDAMRSARTSPTRVGAQPIGSSSLHMDAHELDSAALDNFRTRLRASAALDNFGARLRAQSRADRDLALITRTHPISPIGFAREPSSEGAGLGCFTDSLSRHFTKIDLRKVQS